jgi:hypothetical protein
VTDDELDLIETKDLLDALSRRNKAVLVVELREVGDEDDGACVWYRGGWVTALGLAVFAADQIQHDDTRDIDARDH